MLPRIQAMFRKTYGPYGGVGVIDKPVGSPGHGSTTTYYEISKFWTKGFTNKCICMTCRCCCLNANLMFGSTLSTAYWIATKKKAQHGVSKHRGGRGPKSWLPNTNEIGLTQCSKVALLSSMVRQPQTRFCRRRLHKSMGDSWGIHAEDQRENINKIKNVHGLG